MENGNRGATWFKVTGGDFGAVKVSGHWVGFKCLHCAKDTMWDRFFGPKAQRWQGPPSKAIEQAMADRQSSLPCQGAEVHQRVIARMQQMKLKGAQQ